jgi:1-deoxy-D-xylulose-5-phosphate synthase
MGQELAQMLEAKGYSAAVVNARFAKPLDRGTLEFFARSCDLIVTFEDHVLKGGFGAAVLEELSELGLATPVVRIGWPDAFVNHGKVDILRAQSGLTAQAALEKAQPYLAKIKPSQKAAAAVA